MLGRVYKIVDLLSDDVYVGSTFRELSVRFLGHFTCPTTVIGKLMRERGKDRCKIILIKEYEVADVKQLHAYEQLWINKTKCINKQSAFSIRFLYRTRYRIYNKDKIRDYMISYRTRYREANRDKLNEIDRLYREANREKIKDKQNQKIDCECAGSFTRANKAKHFKTKQHLAWLESKK